MKQVLGSETGDAAQGDLGPLVLSLWHGGLIPVSQGVLCCVIAAADVVCVRIWWNFRHKWRVRRS